MSERAISFSLERCRLVGGAARRLRHCLFLLGALLRWLFSFPRRNGGRRPPCSPHPDSPAVSARLVKDGLRVLTYGEAARGLLRGGGAGAGAETCAVCLGELRRRDRVRVPRNCRHLYHRRCLDRWIDRGGPGTCPLCRAPLLPPPPPADDDDERRQQPSWAVEQLLYLFGDDLLPATCPSPTSSSSS